MYIPKVELSKSLESPRINQQLYGDYLEGFKSSTKVDFKVGSKFFILHSPKHAQL